MIIIINKPQVSGRVSSVIKMKNKINVSLFSAIVPDIVTVSIGKCILCDMCPIVANTTTPEKALASVSRKGTVKATLR